MKLWQIAPCLDLNLLEAWSKMIETKISLGAALSTTLFGVWIKD